MNTRRDFLKMFAASGAEAPPAPDPAHESYVIRVGRRAMACQFEICLNAGQYPQATQAALDALDLLEPLETQMSVFQPESEISRINLLAGQRPVEVEPQLFALLELALRLHRQTQGAYDITSGPLWEAWGFARRAGAIPSAQRLAEARQRVGGQCVELNAEARTIRFLRPGLQLNLGSIGKGYAVDRLAQTLQTAGIHDFLIHGGQSSMLAAGTRGSLPTPATSNSPHWSVGIRNPAAVPGGEQRIAEIHLRDRALGTSGAQFQSFRYRGRRYGHILDPRSGEPAAGVFSATVLAPTAALADALSTAFYVMGPQAALAYCREHAEIAVIMLCPRGHETGWQVHSAGLAADQWDLLAQ
ncbi:MAG: FAD:protein FMN transferase [Thermoguttaceae bacterium]